MSVTNGFSHLVVTFERELRSCAFLLDMRGVMDRRTAGLEKGGACLKALDSRYDRIRYLAPFIVGIEWAEGCPFETEIMIEKWNCNEQKKKQEG